jgi:hypothetical protein
MASHADLLDDMPLLRAALIRKYTCFLHETPEVNINGIRRYGLLANRDAAAPPEVQTALDLQQVPILCLHPLGARLRPRGAASTLCLQIDQPEPPRVSFAFLAPDLPQRVGLDWSFEWHRQEAELRANEEMPLEAFVELAVQLVNDYGSIAAYDRIGPECLHVFCNGDPPANPLEWRTLNGARNDEIMRHR